MSEETVSGRKLASHLREKLIGEVKRCPILYNTNHEGHKDLEMRDRAWADIADRMGENSEVLKREWKILRDSLRQALKNKKSRRWYFESKMSYLLPFMTKRPRYSQEETDYKVEDLEVSAEAEPASPAQVEAVEVDRCELWAAAAAAGPAGGADALELFFASVCQSTRKLPTKLQHQVKRQVLEVLLKAEEQAEGADVKGFGDL